MSFCNNCGKQIQDNVRFCKYCGAEVKAAPPPAIAYADSGEEETVFMGPAPVEQVEVPMSSREDDYAVVAVFDEPPKKKKHIALWIVLLLLILLLAGAAFYLIYNDNYKAVLTSIGIWQESEPIADLTEPVTIAPTQTDKRTEPPLEFVFPEVKTSPPTTTASEIIMPSGVVNVQEQYQVVTTGDDLRIRIGPGTGFEQIGRVPNDTIVIITQRHNNGEIEHADWGYLVYNGAGGWVSMDFLLFIG